MEVLPDNRLLGLGGRASTGDGAAVYGTRGVAAPTNIPGGRAYPNGWSDASGNHWLFGGYAFDAMQKQGLFSDVWMFSPSTKQWTWESGSSTGDNSPVFGSKGSAAAGNVPGGREYSVSWSNPAGDVWIFGGYGTAAATGSGNLNDLWKFSISTKQWTWLAGSQGAETIGIYGTLEKRSLGQRTWIPDGRGRLGG